MSLNNGFYESVINKLIDESSKYKKDTVKIKANLFYIQSIIKSNIIIRYKYV